MNQEPEQIEVRAIDIVPYEHAIWCSVGDSAPFANSIVSRRWSEDGKHIWFMLDSHNFHKAAPDELVRVVQTCAPGTGHKPSYDPQGRFDNATFIAARPAPALSPEERAERAWAAFCVSLHKPDESAFGEDMFKAGYLAALKETSK